ncbi:hypothetical protein JB92DRAFT_2836718 [Gautieria morchelliformis]|nr:hypothetical protein JB92DRAFT_2836718 [Gautieria morchelliformis]
MRREVRVEIHGIDGCSRFRECSVTQGAEMSKAEFYDSDEGMPAERVVTQWAARLECNESPSRRVDTACKLCSETWILGYALVEMDRMQASGYVVDTVPGVHGITWVQGTTPQLSHGDGCLWTPECSSNVRARHDRMSCVCRSTVIIPQRRHTALRGDTILSVRSEMTLGTTLGQRLVAGEAWYDSGRRCAGLYTAWIDTTAETLRENFAQTACRVGASGDRALGGRRCEIGNGVWGDVSWACVGASCEGDVALAGQRDRRARINVISAAVRGPSK